MINLIFLGHLDNKALIGGVGMGQAVIHLMGFSIILGLNSALDTLIS
jgi:Na+-driven multidrug efflux pump